MSTIHNVQIHDNPPLFTEIKVTDPTIQFMNGEELADVINTLSYTIQLMTRNLPLAVKSFLSTTTVSPNRGIIWLYNCDPRLRTPDEWESGSSWELLSNVHGYESLANVKTADGRNYSSALLGVGGTVENPLTSICVHNIACNPAHRLYADENIFVHEYAHTILEVGVALGDNQMYNDWKRIHNIYTAGLPIGKCPSTYSCDARESFALASQVWFDVTRRGDYNDLFPGLNTIEAIRNIGTASEPNIMYRFLENLYGLPVNLCIDTPGQYGYDESALMRNNCRFCN